MKEKQTLLFSIIKYLKISFLLVFINCFSTINAQTIGMIKVSGTVVESEAKEPLVGVSVKLKNQSRGTITNQDGQYSIEANIGATLSFSYIGSKTKEVKIKQARMDIVLENNIQSLSEVVINSGYGTQRKRDNSGAITSVNEQKINERMPVSVLDALKGTAPGVQVSSPSGAPGEISGIRIRGTSTLSDDGVAPLYIVDGMAVDNINVINPGDIKSMEILKDAASASIYGSRSANGVILITTKSGEIGKTKIDVKFVSSYSKLAHKLLQSNRIDYNVYLAASNSKVIGVPAFGNDSTALSKNSDTDYQDLLTQVGVRNQLDLTLSGGNKALRYFNNLQYYDETGIIKTSSYKRLTDRINIDYSPNDIITIGSRISLTYNAISAINEGGTISRAFNNSPTVLLFLPNGDYPGNTARRNPEMELFSRQNFNNNYGVTIYHYVDLKPLKSLTFHADISGKFDLNRNEVFNSKAISTSTPKLNSGNDLTVWNTYLAGNMYLTYKNSFNNEHNVEATVGTAVEEWNATKISIGGNNYVTEDVTTMNSASVLLPATTFTNKESHDLIGYFCRARYDYKSRYLFSATVRRDGSSRFGVNNRWGYFPSLSSAWRISDEKFMNWTKPALDDAKVRISWGVTGNERIGNYDSQSRLVFGSYYYNGVSGIIPNTTIGNPNLKWEETKQSNIGLDMTFLNGAISFVADYYIKDTHDLLYNKLISLESGYGFARMNYGSMQNKGVELSLSAKPYNTKTFSWTTTLNYTQNKNMITDLPEADYANDIWWIGKGYAAGTFYGYKYLGIYQYDQSNAWTDDYKTNLIPVLKKDESGNEVMSASKTPTVLGYNNPDGTPYAGTVRQKTVNGQVSKGGDVIWQEVAIDGDVNTSDRQVLGSAQPIWYGSWDNNFTYKQFGLNFSFYGSFGNQIYNSGAQVRNKLDSGNNIPLPDAVYNIWKYPGQNTYMYAYGRGTENNRRGSSLYIEDGSFIRLQSVNLTYTLDSKIAKKLKLSSFSVNIYVNDLFTWTNYTGSDPEVNLSSVLTPGDDSGRYPRKREYGFGIKVSL